MRQWWKGETPAQAKRQAKALRHPVRSGFITSLFWGVGMWAFTGFTTQPGVLTGLMIGSFGFGFGLIWWMRRSVERSDT